MPNFTFPLHGTDVAILVDFDQETVQIVASDRETGSHLTINLPPEGAKLISVALAKGVVELALHKLGVGTQTKDGKTKVIES